MKTYTDEEISGLIEELRAELPALLKSELASAEPLAKMEAAKEGGNGTKPVVAGGMKKEEPVMKEASDEASKPPAKDDSASPSASASPPSDSPPADDAPPSDGPPMDGAGAPPGDPAADPAAAGDGMGGGDQGQSLEQAYGQLAPEDLRAHYEAIKMVIMQQMQQGAGGMGQDPSMGAPPAGPPAAPPAGPPMGKQMAPMAGPPAPQMGGAPMMRSEAKVKEEELAKAEKVADLEKQVQGLTTLLETMLTKPVQKSVTSMAQYLAKSELDKPAAVSLSREEVKAKLAKAARKPDLAKSDRDLINRFVLQGDVNVKDIEHLLK